MTTRWTVVLTLVVCAGINASRGMVALSVDRATGSFTLTAGPEFQNLTVSGRIGSTSTRSKASLPGDARALELESTSGGRVPLDRPVPLGVSSVLEGAVWRVEVVGGIDIA
jgi:hypothetical protein